VSKRKPLTSTTIRKHYKPAADGSSLTRRAAHFYDWAAKKYPKVYISWVLAYRASTGFWRASTKSKEVELFRKRGSAIRNILIDDYGREFTTKKGLGARAQVDGEDTLKNEMVKKARRLQSAIRSAERTRGLIKASDVKDPEWRSWLTRSLSGAIKLVGSDEYKRKLLPPGCKDAEVEKAKAAKTKTKKKARKK
jgi:hypothetical protein